MLVHMMTSPIMLCADFNIKAQIVVLCFDYVRQSFGNHGVQIFACPGYLRCI